MVLFNWGEKYKRFYIAVIVLSALVIVVAVTVLLFNSDRYNVKAGRCEIKAEAALTEKAQYKGLSDRKALAANRGMLFLFEEAADRAFVMRDMRFALDIIYIRNHQVVNLFSDLPPEGKETTITYNSGSPVDAVLEVPAGTSRDCGIAVGSEVTW